MERMWCPAKRVRRARNETFTSTSFPARISEWTEAVLSFRNFLSHLAEFATSCRESIEML